MEVGAGEVSAPSEEERLPESEQKTSAKTSGFEVFGSPEPAPILNIKEYQKRDPRARKRKYEQPGIHDDLPIRDVVLFRHKMGRHIPGMSVDMQSWYDFYYFTKPTRAERTKDAKDYERHCRSYERGRKWIAQEEGTEALGDSGKIITLRKRSTR